MRKCLDSLGEITNPGLHYAKYATETQFRAEERSKLLKDIVKAGVPDAYKQAVIRRSELFRSLDGFSVFELALKSPLVIGLGRPSVFEIGIDFCLPYGVPVIRGSGLKGLMRRVAARQFGVLTELAQLRDESSHAYSPMWTMNNVRSAFQSVGGADTGGIGKLHALFGDREGAGCFRVYDAWPRVTDGPLLKLDTITPHNHVKMENDHVSIDYSREPKPVSFLAIRRGARFAFAIEGDDEHLKQLQLLLTSALEHFGCGAKTSSGYGRFKGD